MYRGNICTEVHFTQRKYLPDSLVVGAAVVISLGSIREMNNKKVDNDPVGKILKLVFFFQK